MLRQIDSSVRSKIVRFGMCRTENLERYWVQRTTKRLAHKCVAHSRRLVRIGVRLWPQITWSHLLLRCLVIRVLLRSKRHGLKVQGLNAQIFTVYIS